MKKVNLTQVELDKLKVIADFSYFDEFQDKASFPQFEKCFAFLFLDTPIKLEKVYKDLCGKKKKYLNFKRLVGAYLQYKKKKNSVSPETGKFFDTLFNKIVKTSEEEIGIKPESDVKQKIFTCASCKNRDFISKLCILTDEAGLPRGLKVEYDDIIKALLYDQTEEGLYTHSELELELIEQGAGPKKKNDEIMKKVAASSEFLIRDSITHIFGTYTNRIEFLGFKTRAGKIYFEGHPLGSGFLFGQPKAQLHYLKFRYCDGIQTFQPFFSPTPRENSNLQVELHEVTQNYLDQDPLIHEEVALDKIKDEATVEKYISSAPIVADDQLAPVKLRARRPENDLGLVAKKEEKDYIVKNKDPNEIVQVNQLTVEDILGQAPTQGGMPGEKKKKHKREKKDPNDVRKRKRTKEDKKKAKKMQKLRKKGKKVKPKGLSVHPGREQALEVMKNKHQYNQLKDMLKRNIKNDLNKEKDKVRKKKEEKDKKRGFGPMPGQTDKYQVVQAEYVGEGPATKGGKPGVLRGRRPGQQQESAPVLRGRGGQTSSGSYVIYGNSNGYYGPSSMGGFGGFGGFEDNQIFTTDDFFNDFLNDDRNDFNQLDTMSDDDLMKLFYKGNDNSGFSGYNEYGGYIPQQVNKYGYGYYDIDSQPVQPAKPKEDKGGKKKEKKEKKDKKKEKLPADPAADKRAKANWNKLKEGMDKQQLIHVFKTMGAVLKALDAFKKDSSGEKPLDLTEKIRLYQILEENENIVDFLSQERPEEEFEEEEEEEDEEIEGLEEIDSLGIDDLNARIQKIEQLRPKYKGDTLNKLNTIYDACVQRKNEIIAEEEQKAKEEMIKKEKINQEKIKREEEEKRKKAQEEKEKLLNNLLDQNKKGVSQATEEKKKKEKEKKKEKPKDNIGFSGTEKMSEAKRQEILRSQPDPNHAYRDQKYPTGSAQFTDPLFPATQDNLCPVKGNSWILPPGGLSSDVDGWEAFDWSRASDIFKGNNFKVFNVDDDDRSGKGPTIEDDDIIQGSIGNCYFLSAVAALACQPAFIEKLFYKKDRTPNGAYGVFYCMNGEWKMIVVDDLFPSAGRYTKRFAFSNANGNEIWVNLLEKAWAKIHGSYIRIGVGGQPHEVFDVITEAYSEVNNVKEPKGENDPFWDKLVRSQQQNFIMTCGTDGSGEAEEYGLVSGHAYTLTKVFDLYPGTSKHLRLVRVRNPWGNGEWTGDYCDDSPLWTPELKRLVEFEELKDDGEFYMTYEDWCHFYAVNGICHFDMNKKYTTKKVSANKKRTNDVNDDNVPGRFVDHKSGTQNPVITKVKILGNNCDVYFRICQKNPRFKPLTCDYHKECVLEYIMLLDDQFNYILSESNDDPTTCIRLPNLNAGTYYIITDTNYRYNNDDHGYVISAYSTQDVVFEDADPSIDVPEVLRYACKDLIKKVYAGEIKEDTIDKTKLYIEKGEPKQPTETGNGAIKSYTGKAFSQRVPFQIFYYENYTNAPATATVTAKARGNGKVFAYCDKVFPESQSTCKVEIPAGGDNILLLNKSGNSTTYSLSTSMSYASNAGRVSSIKSSKPKAPAVEPVAPGSKGSQPKAAEKKPSQPAQQAQQPEQPAPKKQTNPSTAKLYSQPPQALDSKGQVNQYYLQEGNGFLLGIENKTNRDFNMRLDLQGLKCINTDNYGKSTIPFTLKSKTRRTFATEVSGEGGLSFAFVPC